MAIFIRYQRPLKRFINFFCVIVLSLLVNPTVFHHAPQKTRSERKLLLSTATYTDTAQFVQDDAYARNNAAPFWEQPPVREKEYSVRFSLPFKITARFTF